LTEKAGAALVSAQEAEVERLEREAPAAPAGAEMQLVSVDGAMVPLMGGEWTEVKTLAIGAVSVGEEEAGQERVIKTGELSYFSRSLESEEYARQALVEVHRRGVEQAERVCAVCDGAEWEQKFIDYHCPGAVRILDFPHAAEYVAAAGRSVYGEGSVEFNRWFEKQRHRLRHGEEGKVLAELSRLSKREADSRELIDGKLEYLRKRREMIRYQEFVELGYPIGSGSVESANKVVIQARMKQAGMRWARRNVNAIAALRNVACNERWEEAWPQIASQQREERTKQRLQKHPPPVLELVEVMADEVKRKDPPAMEVAPAEEKPDKSQKAGPKQSRPVPDTPWRLGGFNFGNGRLLNFTKKSDAKS
jgi:hypothetical protein